MVPRRNALRRQIPWLLLAVGTCVGVLASLQLGGARLLGLTARKGVPESDEGGDRRAAVPEAVPRTGPTLAGRGRDRVAARGPVTVLVCDRGGAPMWDVEVEVFEHEVGQEQPAAEVLVVAARTDARGRVSFSDLPYDGSLAAMVRRVEDDPTSQLPEGAAKGYFLLTAAPRAADADPEQPPKAVLTYVSSPTPFAPMGSAWRAAADVWGPEVTLVLDRGLPLRLEVREGGQGRTRRDLALDVWPRWTRTATSGHDVTLALLPGDDATVRCKVAPSEGWVVPAQETWPVQVHPLAERLEAIVPLRPEADVVLVVPEECRPFRREDCQLTIRWAQAQLKDPVIEYEGQDRLRLRGAPFLVGDWMTVSGSIGPQWTVRGTAYLGDEPRGRVVVSLVATRFDQLRVISMGVEDSLAGSTTTELTSYTLLEGRVAGPVLPRPAPYGGSAPLALRICRWDGAPAANARVTVGNHTLVVDPSGHVRVPAAPLGRIEVRVVGAGASFQQLVDVSQDGPEQLLMAPAGGTLDVEVVDDEGRGLPYPHIALQRADGLPHLEVLDGTQRIDPYGDAEGRRTYRFVSRGKVTVRATFGSRSAKARVALHEGGREPVRIVLPAHRPPPPQPPDASPR